VETGSKGQGISVNTELFRLLDSFSKDSDGIYVPPMPPSSSDQEAERAARERVAALHYDDYLAVIARYHSIPVMDREIDRFLAQMPRGGLILDIGGCWGWHWRRLAARPDVGVVIIDFVRANLLHAQKVLGSLVGTQVALMHADATALPFAGANASFVGFDGVWTVQAFQHIPNFTQACREAHRVLKPGGYFVNYSLHSTPLSRIIYRVLGKSFHTQGKMNDAPFHLSRASDRQRQIVADIFQGRVIDRYTECLFHPGLLHIGFAGRPDSRIGRFDAFLSNLPSLGQLLARQRSFEIHKSA
jgi:ubiquinone/menaquinone biosynthesis C-methylase UbiE